MLPSIFHLIILPFDYATPTIDVMAYQTTGDVLTIRCNTLGASASQSDHTINKHMLLQVPFL